MPATKRKSDTSNPASSKKSKKIHAEAVEAVQDILSNPDGFDAPDHPTEVRRVLIELAQYARSLEGEVNSTKPKEKSSEELEAAAEKLRAAARSGIRKQMTWKPSCKTGSAKWVYDGVCSDPAVFGAFLGLGTPPSFKMKKFSRNDFEDLLGGLRVPVRCVFVVF